MVQPRCCELEIDEPRACDLDGLHLVDFRPFKCHCEVVGNVARRPTSGLGHDEGDVGRPIAVLQASRTDELDVLRFDWNTQSRKSGGGLVGETSLYGHWSLRMAEVQLACNPGPPKPS